MSHKVKFAILEPAALVALLPTLYSCFCKCCCTCFVVCFCLQPNLLFIYFKPLLTTLFFSAWRQLDASLPLELLSQSELNFSLFSALNDHIIFVFLQMCNIRSLLLVALFLRITTSDFKLLVFILLSRDFCFISPLLFTTFFLLYLDLFYTFSSFLL